MKSFLNTVVHDILDRPSNLADFTFVLPSKRAGIFLKNEFKSSLTKTTVLPEILSIDEFICDLSNINLIDTTTLLFEFYRIYKQNTKAKELNSFERFSSWAAILLQDFNEIDRHLIDPSYIFNYLNDIKRLEQLLNGKPSTDLINNRFAFFENLENYYTSLHNELLEKKVGYQGLQYKEAINNLQFYINSNSKIKLVFVGFNALNKAEEKIFQELLQNGIATIYWDIDQFYYRSNHSSSSFIKKYLENWNYYKNNPFKWMTDSFSSNKNINIIGAPKKNSQIRYVSEILSSLKNNTEDYQNTALVLADESLLSSALNSLPRQVEAANITMGYELKNVSLANLFELLFKLHINSRQNGFYYKDLLFLLSNYVIKSVFKESNLLKNFTLNVLSNNYTYISSSQISELAKENSHEFEKVSFLFENWQDNATRAIENCVNLIKIVQENVANNQLEKEYLYRFYTIFQQLLNLNETFGYITNINSLYQFYNQLLQNEKLSFKGEPLSGLQIMGMLETRVLDFKNIIITSVNEGILPTSKSDNSFIPFDVKKEVGLPTYQEKDAIFSYHFFRLLQRAENIYLIYNTESDVYGSGEQSRFLTQLEILKENQIKKYVVSPKVVKSKNELKEVSKNELLINNLQIIAEKGFSPTALITFILNPFEFYKEKILKIQKLKEVEETIATNTLGSIIHKTLESLYLPYLGKYINEVALKNIKSKLPIELTKWFKKEYGNYVSFGKNLLIYNVALQFLTNYLKQEFYLIKQGKKIKIIALEIDLETTLLIDGLDFPIKLTGQADRIDEIDGTIRIIDYKTGKVEQKDLSIKDWNLIITDYKYSKCFQILFYAFLYTRMHNIDIDITPIESGIISFKNLKSGFMKVNKNIISKSDLDSFALQLKQLLLDIFTTDLPIIEKEINFYS